MNSPSPLPIVVLISGGGTTLRNLIEQIAAGRLNLRIVAVISSSTEARGLVFAQAAGIETHVIERWSHDSLEAYSQAIFDIIREAESATPAMLSAKQSSTVKPAMVSPESSHESSSLVVMAGWLKLLRIPPDFANRVVNIHPGLIPAFCGQGMYGHRVHQAVLDYGAKLSGCTVHFVDNQYDHGPIILQQSVPVLEGDTVDSLAARVFAAECELYPAALRLIAAGRVSVEGRHVHVGLPQT